MEVAMGKKEILEKFEIFFADTGGFDSWIKEDSPEQLFERLSEIDRNHLSMAQFNQLLVLCHEAGATQGFFKYYWLSKPEHVYDISKIPDYEYDWDRANEILSLKHLSWGLYRFYVDALLFFGSARTAYRELRKLDFDQLTRFYSERRYDTGGMQHRGTSLPLNQINRDDRYLISEMACKSYDIEDLGVSNLEKVLIESYKDILSQGIKRITIKALLDGEVIGKKYSEYKSEFLFSSEEILDLEISSEEDLKSKIAQIAIKFIEARKMALKNTELYLSMVDQLDVYVATSMRSRNDFRKMATLCDKIFSDPRLKTLNIRYFDPTLSAASGHMDKGLIECLMVKCAKALVYTAGESESYGKDVEAAMALSQGKPVIFMCDAQLRERFYRDVHPLSRLIDFKTGVAVGAMVTSNDTHIPELLYRIFENKMEYEIEQPREGLIQLKEKLTKSVVRFQTNDNLLRETFWNYYHNIRDGQVKY